MLGASRSVTSSAEGLSRVIKTETFTTAGGWSFTIPTGTVYIEVEMWGAGGGGGYGFAASGRGGQVFQRGGGGGGGAYARHRIRTLVGGLRAGDLLLGQIGAGGAGDENTTERGEDGGKTTLGTHRRTIDGSLDTITTFQNINAGGGGGGKSYQAIVIGDDRYRFSAGGTVGSGVNLISINGATGEERGGANTTGQDGAIGANVGGIIYLSGSSGEGGTGGASFNVQGAFSAALPGSAPGGGGGGAPTDCAGFCTSNSEWSGDGANGQVVVKAFG